MCRLVADDSIIAVAIGAFIAEADPNPGFLLYVPSTDSTPPASAVQAMQNHRATYLYSTDPGQRTTVERRLESIGDYASLLIAYHGLSRSDAMHPSVRLSGHYVTGSTRGAVIGPVTITLQCDSAGAWEAPVPPPSNLPAPTRAAGAFR